MPYLAPVAGAFSPLLGGALSIAGAAGGLLKVSEPVSDPVNDLFWVKDILKKVQLFSPQDQINQALLDQISTDLQTLKTSYESLVPDPLHPTVSKIPDTVSDVGDLTPKRLLSKTASFRK